MMPDYATRQRLIDRVLQLQDIQPEPDDDKKLRKLILNVVLDHYSGSRLGVLDMQAIVDRLFHAMRGLDVLQPLMDDPAVTEIMVNGPHQVFIEVSGRIGPSPLQFDHVEHLAGMISRYFGQANRLINEKDPIASLRLPDGCRVHAVLPPVAPEGPVLSIRKFTGVRPELPELIQAGFISQAEADYLAAAVKARQNLFISGGTGTGKTTFLNALSTCIPRQERVITIEDSAELDLKDLPNRVRLESRQPGPDQKGEISLGALIQSALRMRPDRILVGEVRGAEVFAMLQAMNTGHPGSMSTGHANSALEMLERLGLMVLMEIHLPWDAIVRLVSSALQLIVHLERSPEGVRRVCQICRVKAGSGSGFELEPVSVSYWQGEAGHDD
ncbi:MAG: CpaF family protein [Clostridia bacterium]|nr:CpaF family protein [Clostridia bacterium]NCC75550.1 CpaF family protein [Clostridia bacterium]